MKSVVIALGGNAINQPGQRGTFENQYGNVEVAMEQIFRVRESGWRVILTSGNGPQVGAIKLQNQAAAEVSPEMPLHSCGAMSQGFIASMMVQAMNNRLLASGDMDTSVVGCVTHSIVSSADKAFTNPTKPVGRFYTEAEAKEEMAKNPSKVFREDAGRGWRVVVPSPRPLRIVEYRAIKSLIDSNVIVVCTNGGGIPVVQDPADPKAPISGVDAVIDKDLATSLLAQELGVDCLVILTDVTNAYINYGKPDARALGEVRLSEILSLEKEGHFKAGSMGPKVRAAIEFVEATGKPAIISCLSSAVDALAGKVGTRIIAG